MYPNSTSQIYCYLDFESDSKETLYLAGIYDGKKFRQEILHPDLKGLADAKDLSLKSPYQFINQLITSAQERNIIIVGYSLYERNIINKFLDPDSKNILQNTKYLNLRKAAKIWINQNYKKRFEELPPVKRNIKVFQAKKMRFSLASVMRLTTYNAPNDYAAGKTTKRIFDILSGLKRTNGQFSDLTRVQKAKVTRLFKHNEFDVLSMDTLLKKIIIEDAKCLQKALSPVVA